MSDSTSPLDLIAADQAQKEVTANAAFNAASPATLYARRATTTALLTWGYHGGRWNGTAIANGTVTLTASGATNHIVALRSTGAVSTTTASTNWNNTADYLRLYKVMTNSTTVTSYEDHRQAIGASSICGVATLVGGAVTVSCASVTESSVIQVTSQSDGGTPGWLRIASRTPGTGFVVTSSDAADASAVGWTLNN